MQNFDKNSAPLDGQVLTRKRRKGIYILPNLFTLAALFGGFYAVVMAMNGRFDLAAVGVFGLCMVVFGLSTSLWLSMAVLAISGAADMVSVVIRQTLVQLETPDEMRGRVSAVNSIFIGASNQLGEFESGATAALLGPVGSVVLGGIGTLLVALWWTRLFPSLAQRDRLTTEPEQTRA